MTNAHTPSESPGSAIPSIYCLKAIGAFFVVGIHTYYTVWTLPVMRTAVPLFLMISGYFLYRPGRQEAVRSCLKAFRKMFWLTFYAQAFYYLCIYFPGDILPIRTAKEIFEFIVFGIHTAGHLWYLNAYLITLLIVAAMIKLRCLKWLWVCIPLFVCIGLLGGFYLHWLPDLPFEVDFIHYRNFLTIGIPCFGVGWLIRRYEPRLTRLFDRPVVWCLVLVALSIAEMVAFCVPDRLIRSDLLITTLPLSAMMMLAALKYKSLGSGSWLELIGKRYATAIYVFHIMVFIIFRTINLYHFHIPEDWFPIVVYLLTLIFAMLWRRGSEAFLKVR